MSKNVVVPARDYLIPVSESRDRETIASGATGFLLINATDRLLINATDKLIIRGGSAIESPSVVVPFRDYIIPVPERLPNG